MSDLALIESAVIGIGPDDMPDVRMHLADPETASFDAPDDAPLLVLLDPAQFHEQTFIVLHVVGSGVASVATQREVDLVAVATSDHGAMASAAIYRVLERYDFTRRWMLTPGSSALIDFAMLLTYGQTIAAAIRNAPYPVSE